MVEFQVGARFYVVEFKFRLSSYNRTKNKRKKKLSWRTWVFHNIWHQLSALRVGTDGREEPKFFMTKKAKLRFGCVFLCG